MQKRLPLRALLALTTAAFVTVLTEALPAGVLPAMSADLKVSVPTMGQAVTVYALGTVVAAIPLSSATSGWPRKRLLLAGVAGFAVANTVTALSVAFGVTMVARFVAGMAAGLVWALLAGYARRLAPEGLQGKAIAVVMAGIPLALSLGVPAGTLLGGLLSWRATFGVMTVLAVGLIGWIVVLLPDLAGQPRGARVPLRRALTRPGVPAVLFVTLVFVLAHTILYTYVATFLAWIGLGSAVDLVLLAFGCASMVSIWVVGRWIDRRLRALTVAGTVLVALAVSMLALWHGNPVLVYLAAGLWGLGFGGVPTLLQTAVAKAGGDAAEAAQAVLVTLWNAAIAGGGIGGGLLLGRLGVGWVPVTALVLLVPVLVVVISARRHGFAVSGVGRADRAGDR